MMANGSMDSVALDPKSDQAAVLTLNGVELPGPANNTSISWRARYRRSKPELHVAPIGGTEVSVPVDRERLDEVVAEALLSVPDLHVHDEGEPASQEFFPQMFEGEGLEDITSDVVKKLFADGWKPSAIDQGIAADAMTSRLRMSLLHSGGSSKDDKDLVA